MSGGAGDFSAGEGPAGFDPVVENPNLGAEDAARALLFDLTTREFPPLPDGSLQEVHWVDAAVALMIGFELGGIPAAPEKGLNTRRLRRVSRATARQATQNEVRVSLKSLIDDDDITLLSVTVETASVGRLVTEIKYVNNRLFTATRRPTTLRLLPS